MPDNKTKIVEINATEAKLKRKLRRHLRELGFRKTRNGNLHIEHEDKDVIRTLHSAQRRERLKANRDFLQTRAQELFTHFASGADIDPARISPALERVSAGTWQGDLFRLAALTWSVPVSHGFGRRLRYLVWDRHNDKLIGLIAIGDPVFNLGVRDNLIGWNVQDRANRLVNVMDAYVLGALPPYNTLLGGKLVAALIRSHDIYDDFTEIYGNSKGIISQKKKWARLLAVTTSSSLGRSAVYNRLKLDGVQYFEPIGFTGGWGHFHIPDRLFAELRNYLRDIGHSYADLHSYGQGPNWRLRTTRAALDALNFRGDMLRHGIERQVFICFLASNAAKLLKTGRGQPDLSSLLDVSEIGRLAVERWMLPRSRRRSEYRQWKVEALADLFGNQQRRVRALIDKAC